jgi:hypothetical protein
MSVRLVGSNSGLLLYAGQEKVAFASIWRVDWSEQGRGESLVVLHDDRLRILGPDPDLGAWLAASFVRHFTEVDGLPWPEPEFTVAPVDTRLDLAVGLVATAADVRVEISDIIGRRFDSNEGYRLGEITNPLSLVYAPCRAGRLIVAGKPVPGEPRVQPDGLISTAFLTEAEVWRHPEVSAKRA